MAMVAHEPDELVAAMVPRLLRFGKHRGEEMEGMEEVSWGTSWQT
jgi:hypothetical protein